MDDFLSNPLVLLVVIPVLLGVLRTLFSDELMYWYGAVSSYFLRPFDLDKNPLTHDWCLLFNGANGEWDYVSLTFHFGWFKGKNGVFVHHYDPEEFKLLGVERVPFAAWKLMRKARINRENVPVLLLDKLRNSPEVNNY